MSTPCILVASCAEYEPESMIKGYQSLRDLQAHLTFVRTFAVNQSLSLIKPLQWVSVFLGPNPLGPLDLDQSK